MKKTQCAIFSDLYLGIACRWWLYIPAVIWGLYVSFRVDFACITAQTSEILAASTKFHFVDVCLYAFHGMTVYDPTLREPFEIPIEWLIWFSYLSLIISQYAHRNVCGIGQQFVIRFYKRQYWWIGKCVWCFFSILLAYIILFFTILLYTLFRGELSSVISIWISDLIDFPILPETAHLGWNNLIILILTTILVSLTSAQLQMTIELFLKPLGAFISILVFYVSSAYIMAPILFGNYAIWVRCILLTNEGLTPWHGILICITAHLISIILGGIKFKHYDIISLQE